MSDPTEGLWRGKYYDKVDELNVAEVRIRELEAQLSASKPSKQAAGKCVTHHYACDCREAYFDQLESACRELGGALIALLMSVREAYEDYYRWIDADYALPVTREYSDCIAELAKRLVPTQEILTKHRELLEKITKQTKE